jgi:hypothetical protein
MPIRFRCAYCNQLMGIARRKAGSVVRCPACSGQVVVPNPDEEEKPSPAEPPIFERNDFDEIFRPAPQRHRPAAMPEAAAAGATTPGSLLGAAGFDVERIEPMTPRPQTSETAAVPRQGIWLSTTTATWLSVAAILALALAFGAGLMVGYYFFRPSLPDADDAAEQHACCERILGGQQATELNPT